jgi:hypothetical protein
MLSNPRLMQGSEQRAADCDRRTAAEGVGFDRNANADCPFGGFLLVFLRGHVAWQRLTANRVCRVLGACHMLSARLRVVYCHVLWCVLHFVTSARLCAGAAALRGMIDDPSSIQQLLADPHLGPLLGSLLTRGT